MERKLDPVASISEKDRVRIENTLLKVKLQVVTIQLEVLLKRNFRDALFSGNFQSNSSSKLILVAGPERLHIKAFLSKTRETSKDQKKTFGCALQYSCSEKKQKCPRKMSNSASVTLICDFIAKELHHGHLFEECINYFFFFFVGGGGLPF